MTILRRMNSGTLAALAAVLILAVVLTTRGLGMFSPGALNAQSRGSNPLGGVTSHAEIGTNCAACHPSPLSKETMAQRCLACHDEVKKQFDTQGPLHGNLKAGTECRLCHSEHRGTHAPLTSFARFDHDCAAFKLTGKHVGLDCKSCHKEISYKAAPVSCVGCHAEPDVHRGRFGTECASCHDTLGWKVAPQALSAFDHDRTAFPLTGSHRKVECASCHLGNLYKATPHACASCHEDPPVPKIHSARYGSDCTKCHTTESWEKPSFKHDIFPITHGGGGKKNTCATCHNDETNFKAYTCYNCHKHAPDKIARSHRKEGIRDFDNCVKCHYPIRRGELPKANLGEWAVCEATGPVSCSRCDSFAAHAGRTADSATTAFPSPRPLLRERRDPLSEAWTWPGRTPRAGSVGRN
jgi:hypothetical protein